MSFCQICGSSLPEGVVACPACGAVQGAAPVAGPGPGYIPASVPMPAAGAGITPNVAGALAYSLGLITGILFLVIDPYKNDRFVRFHAFQAIFFHLSWLIFSIAWTMFGFMRFTVHKLVWLGGFCVWLYMMYSAYQGKSVELPVIGPLAAKQAGAMPGVGQRL